MSDSEEDYMSDAFLEKCQDTRPGLVSNKTAKLHNKESKRKILDQKHKTKPQKVLEEEKRSEGLSTAIGEGNKGFALLQKMGFKPGMAIGKKGTGRIEPVPIKLRTGRGGVGEESDRKRRQAEAATMRVAMMEKRQKREATYQRDYREERSRQMAERIAEKDLYKSQRVCEQLDEEQEITIPIQKYFWTTAKLKMMTKKKDDDEDDNNDLDGKYYFEDKGSEEEEEEDSEDDSTSLPVSEQLKMLTSYLRESYVYCVWCGTRFNDTEDLKQNCPGNTYEAHES